MKKALLKTKGIIIFTVLFANTIFWCIPFYAVTILKIIAPTKNIKHFVTAILMEIGSSWVAVNEIIIDTFVGVKWEVTGLEDLSTKDSYLIISNHVAWVDIVALQKVLNRKVPFIRFFIKDQLKWLPLLGVTFWALDFPFMKRHTKEYLEKYPERKFDDLKTTQKICSQIIERPVSLINFIEGTRISPKKREQQNSPYKHLLKPKAGGMAFTMEAFDFKISNILDVTLIYPPGKKITFLHFLSGQIPKIIVHIKKFQFPEELKGGNYLEDPAYQEKFRTWTNELWNKKDKLIDTKVSSLTS